jgi:CRISPR-associated protein Cas1
MRMRFEHAPPRSSMEMALEKSGAASVAAWSDGKAPAGGSTALERRLAPVAFLYLTEQGTILRKAGDRFLVEKEDEVLLDLPYHKLENVLLFGNIQVTTQALAELLEKGVNLSLFSRQGQYRGSLAPPRGKNIELRVAQFDCYRDPARTLATARAIVAAKIGNGLAVLARYRARNEAPAGFEERRASMEAAAAALPTAKTAVEIDGFEGVAARAYFAAMMQFNKSGMAWPGRQKHPATDPLNALLSLTYTLLMHELTALLEGAGLDPYLGFLHQLDYGRPSLALDLMEPFRHPVADRLTMTLVNREVLGAGDFRSGGDCPGVFLTPASMRRFFGEYERWMLDRPVANEAGGGTAAHACFRDRLKDEVEKLAAALREGKAFEPWRFDAEEGAECNTSSVTI